MAVVIGTSLRKELAGGLLFDGVSFKVERRERLALSGPNGAGKTTLLRMLAGETGIDGGQLVLDKGTRIALHDQRPPLELGLSLRDYALSGARDLIALEDELRRLEAAMAAGDHRPQTLARYSAAQTRLEHAGGYAWRESSLSTLRGLGFADDELDRPLETFSGGELTRASLARSLAGDPDLLLLDEPTNHLDVERLEWLERTLVGMDAGVVLVAHDRWFLEAVATAVLELGAGRSTYFPGEWHVWRREKAARLLDASKSIERYNADIARLQRFVDRFRYKRSKAKQAQAKLTHIGRLRKEKMVVSDQVALLTRRSKRLGFEFLSPPRSGRTVVEVEGLTLSAGDKHLLAGVSLAVERGEHVALVGPNGSGKTTLLETLLGRREPDSGIARLGHGVVPAYFSQHEAELDERGSVLECVQTMTGLRRPEAQNLLGRFLFSGWESHEKPVAVLSGGERRRLALAVVVASGANFLVLDEPTNHLDLESREALEAALENFPATVLLVSHDRALLDAVAERTLAIEGGTIRSYDGGWADYVQAREARDARNSRDASVGGLTPENAPAAGIVENRKQPRPKPPSPKRPSELEQMEARIAAQEETVADLERRLADDWGDRELLAAHRAARDELQSLLDRWETLFEQAQA
jgi:ATP-binding cassette, subfamily F, member 3